MKLSYPGRLAPGALLATVMLLAACTAPALHEASAPPLPDRFPAAVAGSDAVATAPNAESRPADRWWLALHDPVLDQLIARAQHNNHDVRIALARVAQARAAVPAVDSRSAPQLNLGGDLADNRSSLPAPVKFGMPDVQAAQLNLNLSWELDLMGAAAAGSRAARADLLEADWGVRGAQLMVANEVARNYVRLQAVERGEALARATVATFDLTAQLLAARAQEGVASRLDQERLASARAAAQAALPAYAADRTALRNALALLLGEAPGAALPLPDAAPARPFDPYDPQALLQPGQGLLADPGATPVGQPADLLLRRPDLQAAARRVDAEEARRAEAHADRYPHFFLSALLGGERLNLNSVPYSPARYSNAALAFSAPLLNGDRLAAQEDLQAARSDEALLAYQQAVLRAVQEVDSSLARVAAQRQRCQALLESRERALAALARMRALQNEGQSDALDVLDLVRSTFQAQAALLDGELDRGLSAIQLYAALGGGWPDPSPENRP